MNYPYPPYQPGAPHLPHGYNPGQAGPAQFPPGYRPNNNQQMKSAIAPGMLSPTVVRKNIELEGNFFSIPFAIVLPLYRTSQY